jgi:hypothetical protein
VSVCPSSGSGTATPELLADLLGLAQDDLQHGAVDGVVLAVEERVARTTFFSWPKRSTRPSRCSWRVGFHERS